MTGHHPWSHQSLKPPHQKGCKNLSQPADDERIEELNNPGVSSDINLLDSQVAITAAPSTKHRKKPGPKLKAKAVEKSPKPEDLSKLSN
jgi:hypothetical protein